MEGGQKPGSCRAIKAAEHSHIDKWSQDRVAVRLKLQTTATSTIVTRWPCANEIYTLDFECYKLHSRRCHTVRKGMSWLQSK